MKITVSNDFTIVADEIYLGYCGETNSRILSFENLSSPDTDMFRIRILYPDGIIYEKEIIDNSVTLTSCILRVAGECQVQLFACKISQDNESNYSVIRKSNILKLCIRRSIDDYAVAVPTYEESLDILDTIKRSASSVSNLTEEIVALQDELSQRQQVIQGECDTVEQDTQKVISAQQEVTRLSQECADYSNSCSQAVITTAQNVQSALESCEESENNAELSKTNADIATAKAEEISSKAVQIDKNTSDIDILNDFVGYDDVAGICVDFENRTFTRLGGAVGLTQGSDFDRFDMFGKRCRCNVSDDGTVNAYYGDEDYTEDGSNGQVMVYQPALYYMVNPIKVEPIDTGIGYHLRKVNYFVSTKARSGFSLHPAFYDEQGNEVDHIFLSAFEGSIYDVSQAQYLSRDEQVADFSADKLSSIGGVKAASGTTQALTRPNLEKLAKNRGAGWHSDTIKAESANQLLMIIETGTMNLQATIGKGVVDIANSTSYNCSSLTGSTTGNNTGNAVATVNEINGVETTYTNDGQVAVSYRGMENPYGNIYKLVGGINFYGNSTLGGGEVFVCNDYSFAESKSSENYVSAGFTLANTSGYISAMGYSRECDYLFLPSETLGDSQLPVGDFAVVTKNMNGYNICPLGGTWYSAQSAGGFYLAASNPVGVYSRNFGSRLVYVPDAVNQ